MTTNWTGEADAAQETAGGGGGGNFTPAPRGIYTIQVADVKAGKTKESNRDKVDLECEIADEGESFGKKVWLTITKIPKADKGHGLMIHSLHAFGIALDGEFNFNPEVDLQGKTARALLGVTQREKVKDGKTYINDVNFVEELYTEKHPEPAELPAPKEPRKAAAPAAGGPKPSAAAQTVFGKGAAAATKSKQEVPF